MKRSGVLARAVVTLAVTACAIGGVTAQSSSPLQGLVREGTTTQVSAHVYVIPDSDVSFVPNIGIIVGAQGTLVVDTGLGAINAQTVLREVQKVARGPELYVVSTHYHPEHAIGEMTFPDTATIIRSEAQQLDIDQYGNDSLLRFRGFSPLIEELLMGARYRIADRLFDRDLELDLGGVRVRLMSWGPTHTRGDTMVFVEGDQVLFAGDVVMADQFVVVVSPESSVDAWIGVLDALAPLAPAHVVPSHGDRGDGALVSAQRGYLEAVRTRARALKADGHSVDDVATQVTAEMQAAYPDWEGERWIAGAARSAYREAP